MRRCKYFPCYVVALGLAWSMAGCHAQRQAEVRSSAVERLATATADSVIRLITASVDSPEIIIMRLDSPRTYIKVTASRAATTSSILSTSHSTATASSESNMESTEHSTTTAATPYNII